MLELIKKFLIVLISLTLILSCEKDFSAISSKKEKPPPLITIHSESLSGRVFLENQTEQSNALVYIDSLNRGVGTDSSGYYQFQFQEEDSIYSGTFTLYYYLVDYEVDSVQIELQKGKFVWGGRDPDSAGILPPVYLKQNMRVQGWADKSEYHIGDTLTFTGRVTNLLDTTVFIVIFSPYNDFGLVALFRDPSFYFYPLSPEDIVPTWRTIEIPPGSYFEGQVSYLVPPGVLIDDTLYPLHPGEYVVYFGFLTHGYGNLPHEMQQFIIYEWEDYHRGFPQYYNKPNKFELPKVLIIE